MADTKNFPPWTPKDELVMWEMELATVERLMAKNPLDSTLIERLNEADREVAKWKATVQALSAV